MNKRKIISLIFGAAVVLFLIMLFTNCAEPPANRPKIVDGNKSEYPALVEGVVEIEGCEYFVTLYGASKSMTHKGNCKNIIHQKYGK